jgi:hypothetical protein
MKMTGVLSWYAIRQGVRALVAPHPAVTHTILGLFVIFDHPTAE